MAPRPLLLASILTLGLGAACAPRVSRLDGRPNARAQAARAQAAPTAKPAASAAKPAAAPRVAATPAPAPRVAPRELDEGYSSLTAAPPPPPAPEPVVARSPVAPAPRTSFHAFSDGEVNTLRRRSEGFRRLHDRLRACTAKSEKAITQRERVREEIIRLQNEDYRTPRQEQRLAQLRTEERELNAKRGQESGECAKMEVELAELLRANFGDGTSSGARP